MDTLKEYPTLTALMEGREPGSVKVRAAQVSATTYWFRPAIKLSDGRWSGIQYDGEPGHWYDPGPWLIVSEDAPALDTLRLEIAAMVLASLPRDNDRLGIWPTRHAYALSEADALIAEARK